MTRFIAWIIQYRISKILFWLGILKLNKAKGSFQDLLRSGLEDILKDE